MQPRCTGSFGRDVRGRPARAAVVGHGHVEVPAGLRVVAVGVEGQQLVLRLRGLAVEQRRLGLRAEEGDRRAAGAAGDDGRHGRVVDAVGRAEVDRRREGLALVGRRRDAQVARRVLVGDVGAVALVDVDGRVGVEVRARCRPGPGGSSRSGPRRARPRPTGGRSAGRPASCRRSSAGTPCRRPARCSGARAGPRSRRRAGRRSPGRP